MTRPGGSSAMNEVEANAVVRELERILVQQDYKGSVGVVTPFRAQVNRIRDLVHAHPQSTRLLNTGLLIDTVHRFQGDECDVMIFSPVISKGSPKGAIGFLSNNGNLFNVAVTRQRHAWLWSVTGRQRFPKVWTTSRSSPVSSMDSRLRSRQSKRLTIRVKI
ncbi:MAG: hypothetical protein IPN59_12630 [Holophaga sp.]|nr:hypothetical protein [Holophaga sp.]